MSFAIFQYLAFQSYISFMQQIITIIFQSVTVAGDQAWFTISDLGYGQHAISSAIVDNADNSIKKILLRFNIQIFLHAGSESIAYSPVPQQLYNV